MEIEMVKCECCGLVEECTQDYIRGVRASFDGKWLCGLCSEAVRDEVVRGMDDAVSAHMSFCRKCKLSPAFQVADGMKQMLRRRSGNFMHAKNYSNSSASFGQDRRLHVVLAKNVGLQFYGHV